MLTPYVLGSFGGGVLADGNLLRNVYIDEAGISFGGQDPFVVVAAVSVQPDKQWKELKRYYHDLAKEAHPNADDHDRYVFHAKDIWHGSGDFPRKSHDPFRPAWSWEKRLRLYQQLLQVYKLFNLRIGIGVVNRARYSEELMAEFPNATKAAVNAHAHVAAFIASVQQIDNHIEKNFPDEVAQLVIEDSQKMRGILTTFHAGYTELPDDQVVPIDEFRTDRIVDSLTFASKKQSILLQLADHAAFTVKRMFQGDDDMKPFFKTVFEQSLVVGSPHKTRINYRYPDAHVPYLSLGDDERNED